VQRDSRSTVPAGARILLVTDNRFWRRGIGSEQRIWSLYEHLSRHGCDIAVLFAGLLQASDRRALNALGLLARVHDIDSPLLTARLRLRRRVSALLPHRLRRGLRSFASRTEPAATAGAQALTPASIYLRVAAAELMRLHKPRAVLVEYLRLASVVPALRAAAPMGCAFLVDTQDVMHLRAASFAAAGVAADHAMSAEGERAALALFDCVIAITQTDAEAFARLQPQARCLVVPHAIEAEVVARDPHDAVTFGFFGSAMTPNVDAARWLLSEIWPRVRGSSPTARLVIAGAVCESLPNEQRDDHGVEFLGRVGAPADFYRRIDVALCPIRYGSGLKIKNVEALAAGRPLVTTPDGATGLPAADNTGYIVAATGSAFADAMLQLASDERARAKLGAEAVRAAQARFSPAVAYAELDRYFDALGDGAATPAPGLVRQPQ
jgi:glycosyltransferase involved in cell wall biosynthesis